MSNFSKDPMTNAIANGTAPPPPAVQSLQNSYLSGIDNSQTNTNDNPIANQLNTDEVSDLFNSARQDLDQSKQGGITKEQLDALHKHQGANMWTSLFMNLIGRANGVNPEPFAKPLQQKVEQEQQGLGLQNQLAQQQAQRAGQEQSFGLNQLKANQALTTQQILNSPISNIQKALYLAGGKAADVPISDQDLQNKTQMQFGNEFPDIEKLGQLKAQQNMYNLRNYQLRENPWTHEIESYDRTTATPYNGNLSANNNPIPTNNSNQSQQTSSLTYNDLLGPKAKQIFSNPLERDEVIKQLVPIKKDSSSLIKDQNEYQTSVNQLNSEVQESLRGNPVASRTLPDRQAQVLGGLKQKLSNMQVQMQKDPASLGIANQIKGTLQKWSGSGSVTYEEAQDILDLAKQIEGQRQNFYNKQMDVYRNQASALVANKPVNFDQYLFGSTPVNNMQEQQQNTDRILQHQSLDDYLNQRGQ